MKKKPDDHEVLRSLINQVQKAANGDSETKVVTFITKPMWRAFLRATGTNPNSKPTEWNGIKTTIRVFGSKTIVTKSNQMASVSFKIEHELENTKPASYSCHASKATTRKLGR